MARDILVVPINVSTDLYIESIDSPSVVSNNTRVFYARKATDTEYGVVKLTDITAVIGGSRVLNMTGAEILAAASDDTIIVGSVAYCNLDGDIYEQSKLYKLNSDREWVEIDSKYVSEALNAHDIDVTAHDNLFTLKLDKKPDGSVNLIGTDYKIDEKYLPPFAVSGGLVFGGTFGADGLIVATSRTPELNGTLIDNITLATYPSVYFKATASYEFGGKSYDAGDIAICNGDITPNWTKIDGSDAVTGVKGDNELAYRLGNVNITKDNIGLGEVDNTSDEDKPISTATKSYVDEELVKKANLDGATFSGNITIGSTETPKNLEVKGTTTVATPTADLHAATKKYVDDAVVGNPIVTSWSDPLNDSKVPSEKLTKESLDLKADKVESATNGNFAGLDANGNLTDSGKKASDFANLIGGNSFTGVQSLTGTELNLLKLQNTDSASYSRIQYIGTGKTFNAGVGNSSADLTALRDKFYIYDATGSKVLFTIDSDGNIENLGNVNLPTGKTYKINDVDVIGDKAKLDASNLTDEDVLEWQGKCGFERSEVIYDKNSADPNINWGYTGGIYNNISNKTFSKYKRLICFFATYPSNTNLYDQAGNGNVIVLDLTSIFQNQNYFTATTNFSNTTTGNSTLYKCTILYNSSLQTFRVNININTSSPIIDGSCYCYKIRGVY